VYILFSQKDLLLYIGFTSNLEARIHHHNSGKVKSTVGRRPLNCIFAEYFLFEQDARKREGYFKTSMGRKAIRFMLKSTLIRLGYSADSMKALSIEMDPLDDGCVPKACSLPSGLVCVRE
jgi:putative endonuclease